MNIDALEYLLENSIELIEESAISAGVNVDSAEGVAKQVVGEKTIEDLTIKQLYVFDKAIRPLIEGLTCSGQWNEVVEEPECGRPIPDANLVAYYQDDETLCESCQSLSDGQKDFKANIFRD
ncbi:Uncharacterised protein [Serratia quinivorans]|nr:Uncharacterised protein [Serratia quinivorans]